MDKSTKAKEILTEAEFCERYSCCKATAWKLRNDKKNPVPHFLIGNRIRYRLSELEEFFKSTMPSAK